MKKLTAFGISFMLILVIFLCSFGTQEDKATGAGGDDKIKIDYDYLDEYDSGDVSESSITFISPLGGKITSDFGMRIHPIKGKESFHTGIDIGVKEGTRIAAAAGGVVSEVGNSNAYGHFVKIKHDDNVSSFYAHCKEISVEIGTVIRQGETIALSGNTGLYSTGPHLHFEIQLASEAVDPKRYIQVKNNAI